MYLEDISIKQKDEMIHNKQKWDKKLTLIYYYSKGKDTKHSSIYFPVFGNVKCNLSFLILFCVIN